MVAERGTDGESGELPLPDSLQGLISARLDALTRAEKELLQNAAVVGKVFWPGALTDPRNDSPALDESLRALERKEFIRRERRSAVEDELQYAFRHVLVRDVAYAQIPRAVRAERHEQVAAWIERRVRGEDSAELLAHHYLSALEYSRAAGRDAGELFGRARTALRDAGRRSVALNAFGNATRFFEAAIDLTPEEDPEWPQLALEHAEAAIYFDVSSDQLLLRARGALSDVHDAARAEMVLGEYRWLRGDRAGAEEHHRAAELLAGQMTEGEDQLQVLANLARFLMLADENERAVTLGRRALLLAEKLGRDDMRAHALNSVGVARAALGEVAGLAELEASREIARGVSLPEYLRACGNLASELDVHGELRRAAELHREALSIASEIGYEEPTRWLSTEIAWDFVLAGDWEEAWRIVDELIPAYEESPFWIEPQTRICRAHILIAEGAVADATADAAHAVELARDGRSFQSLSAPLAFRARLHAELGELEAAAQVADELLGAWAQTRSGFVTAWILDLWRAASRTGIEARLQSAIEASHSFPWLEVAVSLIRQDFGAAVAQLDGMGAVYLVALARLWWAEWLLEQGRHPEATVQAERSLAFWRSVGATGYVRRSESLRAAAS